MRNGWKLREGLGEVLNGVVSESLECVDILGDGSYDIACLFCHLRVAFVCQ
jgi:hypothetical protein